MSTVRTFDRRWPGRIAVTSAALLSVPFGVHAAGAVTTGTATTNAPPTACEVSTLKLPAGFDQAIGTVVSPDGRSLAGRVYSDSAATPAMWVDGKPGVFDVPGEDPQLRAITDDGTVVGASIVGDQWNPAPWVYRDGKGSVLPGVRGEGEARAINPAGDIAGVQLVEVPAEPPDPPGSHSFPVRWNAETGKAERLPVPDGTNNVYVGGITEDGTVVGIDHTTADQKVYAWPKDGERYELPAPEGTLRPYSIQAAGSKVVADVETANGYAVVRWDLPDSGDPADPVVVTEKMRYVDDVNPDGWVVGTSITETAMFASIEGGELELPTPQGNDPTDTYVNGMNADGRTLVGSSADQQLNNHAVAWSCS